MNFKSVSVCKMCKIMKVRVSFIGIVEERRKEEDPKGPNSNTLYVHTQY